MTQTGRKNCETVGKRVYEMIHDLCSGPGQKQPDRRAFVTQKCNLDFGDSKVSLGLIIVTQAAFELFQEFARERGLSEAGANEQQGAR